MRIAVLLLAVFTTACATAPTTSGGEARGAQVAADPVEADRSFSATLRAITVRVRKGQARQVREELEAQIAQRPREARLKLLLAWVDAPSEESWQQINSLAKVNTRDPWMWTALGLIYMQWRGFLDQAQGVVDKAAAILPAFVPAHVAQADLLRLRGKLPEAKAAYEAVLAEAPEWQEALLGMGLVLKELGDPGARAWLERALAADPDDLGAVRALAELATAAKDTKTMLALNAKMLEYEPQNVAARVALGRARQESGDLEGAAADFETAMKIAPDAEICRALADAYRALQRPYEEIGALERLSQLEPSDPAPLLRIAELQKGVGDLEGAEATLRAAAESLPDDVSILVEIARLVEQREDLVAAIEAWRAAREKGADGRSELTRLERQARLPPRPLSGGVQKLYGEVFAGLKQEFKARSATNPGLGGKLRVKVTIGPDQKASQVELLEDTVHDSVLSALVYFSFKDATYPNERPRSVTFEFVLAGGE